MFEGIDINKTSGSCECIISHFRYFLRITFKFQPEVCNGCHHLMQKTMNFTDVALITIKENDFKILFLYMSKVKAINF